MIQEYKTILGEAQHIGSDFKKTIREIKKRRNIHPDELFHEAHNYAFSHIDCKKCGNCCTALGPKIRNSEIDRLARRSRMKSSVFFSRYLRTDDEGDTVFRLMPCPFFGTDGLCLIYEHRPSACREYPHLDSSKHKNLLTIHLKNLAFCPAVVLALKYLMKSQLLPAGTKGFTRSKRP